MRVSPADFYDLLADDDERRERTAREEKKRGSRGKAEGSREVAARGREKERKS